ncbi:MAG: hypothetical protein HOO96_02515 [Polyangiaceae bacterium]|nr:hypothetical protein [Polyangiaceae bacterium]
MEEPSVPRFAELVAASAEDAAWIRALVERLGSSSAPERALRGLVGWLDDTVGAGLVSVRMQVLVRCTVAAGLVLVRYHGWDGPHPVAITLAAAEAYARLPSEAAHDAYFAAATNSYPYGAGDGCYGMAGAGCAPGSGCRTGAGTLMCVAHEVGEAAVLEAIGRELMPWLEGADDLVLARYRAGGQKVRPDDAPKREAGS